MWLKDVGFVLFLYTALLVDVTSATIHSKDDVHINDARNNLAPKSVIYPLRRHYVPYGNQTAATSTVTPSTSCDTSSTILPVPTDTEDGPDHDRPVISITSDGVSTTITPEPATVTILPTPDTTQSSNAASKADKHEVEPSTGSETSTSDHSLSTSTTISTPATTNIDVASSTTKTSSTSLLAVSDKEAVESTETFVSISDTTETTSTEPLTTESPSRLAQQSSSTSGIDHVVTSSPSSSQSTSTSEAGSVRESEAVLLPTSNMEQMPSSIAEQPSSTTTAAPSSTAPSESTTSYVELNGTAIPANELTTTTSTSEISQTSTSSPTSEPIPKLIQPILSSVFESLLTRVGGSRTSTSKASETSFVSSQATEASGSKVDDGLSSATSATSTTSATGQITSTTSSEVLITPTIPLIVEVPKNGTFTATSTNINTESDSTLIIQPTGTDPRIDSASISTFTSTDAASSNTATPISSDTFTPSETVKGATETAPRFTPDSSNPGIWFPGAIPTGAATWLSDDAASSITTGTGALEASVLIPSGTFTVSNIAIQPVFPTLIPINGTGSVIIGIPTTSGSGVSSLASEDAVSSPTGTLTDSSNTATASADSSISSLTTGSVNSSLNSGYSAASTSPSSSSDGTQTSDTASSTTDNDSTKTINTSTQASQTSSDSTIFHTLSTTTFLTGYSASTLPTSSTTSEAAAIPSVDFGGGETPPLSKTQTAGIAVGGTACLLFALVAGLFVARRYHQKSANRKSGGSIYPEVAYLYDPAVPGSDSGDDGESGNVGARYEMSGGAGGYAGAGYGYDAVPRNTPAPTPRHSVALVRTTPFREHEVGQAHAVAIVKPEPSPRLSGYGGPVGNARGEYAQLAINPYNYTQAANPAAEEYPPMSPYEGKAPDVDFPLIARTERPESSHSSNRCSGGIFEHDVLLNFDVRSETPDSAVFVLAPPATPRRAWTPPPGEHGNLDPNAAAAAGPSQAAVRYSPNLSADPTNANVNVNANASSLSLPLPANIYTPNATTPNLSTTSTSSPSIASSFVSTPPQRNPSPRPIHKGWDEIKLDGYSYSEENSTYNTIPPSSIGMSSPQTYKTYTTDSPSSSMMPAPLNVGNGMRQSFPVSLTRKPLPRLPGVGRRPPPLKEAGARGLGLDISLGAVYGGRKKTRGLGLDEISKDPVVREKRSQELGFADPKLVGRQF